jgi:hypothetical protein
MRWMESIVIVNAHRFRKRFTFSENHNNCPASHSGAGVSGALGQRPAEEKKRRMSLAEKTATICILTIAALAALTGCQSPTGEVFPATSTGHKPGILATGDTIKVAFTSAPEPSQSQKIQPDGKVSLPPRWSI